MSYGEWLKVTHWLKSLGYSVRKKFNWVHPHYTLGFAPKPVKRTKWSKSKRAIPEKNIVHYREAKIDKLVEPLGDVESTVRVIVPKGIKVLVEYE